MYNLYFKKYCMRDLVRFIYKIKIILLFFILFMSFFTYAFAQNRVYFSPWNIYPILNTAVVWTATDLKITTATGVESYGVDIYDQSTWAWQQHPNDKLLITTKVWSPSITYITTQEYWSNWYKNGYYARVYAGFDTNSAAPYALFSDTSVGRLNVINSGSNYLTSAYLGYYTWVSSVTSIDLLWQANTWYDVLSGLNIYFWACPATKDTIAPTFPNNQTTINTNFNFPNRQINRQYKDDFSWVFSLLDNSQTALGSNGWIDTPDFYDGSNFRPNATNPASGGITNQNGIDTWSLILWIKIASGWNHSTTQSTWSTWKIQHVFTATGNAIVLTGWDKTWRWFDKNFTWIVNPNYISGFGVEELVVISWYVQDRDMGYPGFNGTQNWDSIKWYSYWSGRNSASFVYYFNQGMRPWFSTWQSSYSHMPACVLDLNRNQTWVVIRTITGYLHDDWAGINTGSIQIVVTGSIQGILTGKVYTISDNNISLTNFSFTGNGCRVDWTSISACTPSTQGNCGNTSSSSPGNWSTEICDDATKQSTWNYVIVFNDINRIYDPEDGVAVSIVYQDLKNKQWRPVYCDWWVSKAPRFVRTNFVTGTTQFLNLFNNLFVLSNYPNGAQILPINIQLQDDWAGIDTGAITWFIGWNTLNALLNDVSGVNINLAYNQDIYAQANPLWTWDNYPNVSYWYLRSLLNTVANSVYKTRTGVALNNIPNFQNLNYQLSFNQTWNFSTFTWYFAPEYDVNFQLTFKDKDDDGTGWRNVSNPINVTYTNNEAPKIWEYIKTTNFTWWTNQSLSWGNTSVWNYLTWEMAKLFSGDTDSKRIFPYDLTWDNTGELGSIRQTDIMFKTTDNRAWIDSGNVILTITWNRRWQTYTYVFTASNLIFSAFDRWDAWAWNLLNYLARLTNHNIYFDRQSRWGGSPVAWRESRYTVNLQSSDLKKPTANATNISFTRDMENLSCQYLDRCNARLYFTYKYDWVTLEPVIQTWVHPFLWQTLYVITSWSRVIYTGVNENYIACNGAGVLSSPINITFQNWLLDGWETNPYTNYQHSELTIMDGMFEITGGNVLILR